MKNISPNFADAEKVRLLCSEMQTFEERRALDRALIDNLFNGAPPYTEEEAEKLAMQDWNINWGEGGKLLDDANRQINGAMVFKSRLAVLTCLDGAPEKRLKWSETATKHYNTLFQRKSSGRRHQFLLRSRNASVSLHGIGPIIWPTQYSTRKRFVPLEDLLIPTDTTLDHENLAYFAVNYYLTQGELLKMVGGKDPDEGWNVKAVHQILYKLQCGSAKYRDEMNPIDQPEKWIEYRKQNAGFFCSNSDAVPKVALRTFYYLDPETGKWFRKVILKNDTLTDFDNNQFIFESKEPFANSLDEILHIQYGDASRVPPLKYHSVRGIGVALYAPVECMNRVRCQSVRHLFENLLTWFRVDSPADRDRLKHFIFEQFAAVPKELNIIPNSERYQIEPQLLESVQAQFRQLMNESSSSYVRDIESGGKKEMTLGEAQIRLQQVNVQVSSMLRSMYLQETFLYDEDLRRLLLPGSTDALAKRFVYLCHRDGIPKDKLVHECWQVDIEQVLGSGDQTLAQNQANLILSQKGWMDPDAARMAERDWLTVTTGDPAKAEALVPESKDRTTSGMIAAQNLFGTLMQGSKVAPRQGIDQIGYIEQMLTLLGEKVVSIKQRDNLGTAPEALGMQTVAEDIAAHIQILAKDETMKAQVKKFTDALAQMVNEIKGFAQRIAEQGAAGQGEVERPPIPYKDAPESIKRQMELRDGFKPATEPVTDPKMIKAQQSLEIKSAQFQQKQAQQQMAFQLEQARKNMEAAQNMSHEQQAQRQTVAFDSINRALEILNKELSAPKPAGGE
ncbi:MAG: hypothetical protein ACOYD4_03950 [Solirubrobacterales bacterium]